MESQHHGLGGAGAVELAKAVIAACDQPSDFKFLYPLDLSIKVGVLKEGGRGGERRRESVCVCVVCLCVYVCHVRERACGVGRVVCGRREVTLAIGEGFAGMARGLLRFLLAAHSLC